VYEVAVIVPSLNVADVIPAQLRALAGQQTAAGFEILVCDNGSTDDLAGAVRALDDPRMRVVDARAVRGINHARNCGIKAASDSVDLFLFCDADDVVHDGWLDAYWRSYRAGAQLLGGPLRRVTPDGTLLGWQHELNDWLGFLAWPTGANCGITRAVVNQCGYWDESYRGGGDETDVFWTAQLAGFELCLVPDAAVDYVQRATLGSAFRQGRGFGYGHVKLFRRFAARGMPRPKPWATPYQLVRHVRDLLVRRADPASRLNLLKQMGVAWGRLRGSLEFKCYYV